MFLEQFVDLLKYEPYTCSNVCASYNYYASYEGLIDALKAEGLKAVKIIIGGAPVTAEFAEEIGADGYGQMQLQL